MTRQEMEEYGRRAVAKSRETRYELLRLALADEETVKEVDEIRKNGGCMGCHQEQNKNNPDKKPLVSTSNQKTSEPQKQPFHFSPLPLINVKTKKSGEQQTTAVN